VGRLNHKGSDVPEKETLQRSTSAHRLPKAVGFHPLGEPRNLHERLMWRPMVAGHDGRARHSLSPEDANLNAPVSMVLRNN
jgi:hypothetical protein